MRCWKERVWCLEEQYVWLTKKAAEYPTGLCYAWASGLWDYLQTTEGKEILKKKEVTTIGTHRNTFVSAMSGGSQPEKGHAELHNLTGKLLRESHTEAAAGGFRNSRK